MHEANKTRTYFQGTVVVYHNTAIFFICLLILNIFGHQSHHNHQKKKGSYYSTSRYTHNGTLEKPVQQNTHFDSSIGRANCSKKQSFPEFKEMKSEKLIKIIRAS